MLKRFNVNFAVVSLLIDVACTFAALHAAVWLRGVLPYGPDPDSFTLIVPHVYVAAAVMWVIVSLALSVYDPYRRLRAIDELQQVIAAQTIAALCLAGYIFFAFKDMSRFLFVYFFVSEVALLLGWRVVFRLARQLGNGRLSAPRRVLIVGAGDIGRRAAETIAENAWMGFHLIGFIDDDPAKRGRRVAGLPVLGTINAVENVVRKQQVDEVIVALPLSAYEKVVQLSLALQRRPVHLRVVPDYFNVALFQATIEDFGGMPLINLRAPALNDYQRLIKRAFDLIIGALLQVLVLPIMLIITILVKLDSPGPIIYRQQRVGENGKLFWMYKFRTMVADADQRLEEVILQTEDGRIDFKRPDDPRITRFGRFLRRTSLDELPQLFNVLKSDMSLVGPRPELPWLVDRYEPWQHKRFAVPQGITGWWQVNGRSNKHMHASTEDDLYYIQHYSLLLDLLILWKTIGAVLKREGAF
ncbi:MAG TPA: sugar transferase [Anaerolineae bacterium]|nr:sugar transferase [Anaerolineae bacterium]